MLVVGLDEPPASITGIKETVLAQLRAVSRRAAWKGGALMKGRRIAELLALPVRMHGIDLGRPVGRSSIRVPTACSGSSSSAVTAPTASCRSR